MVRIMEIKIEELVSRLIFEFGYPEEGAKLVAEKLAACQPEIKEAFLKWWDEGQLGTIEVEGYTLQKLMEKHSLKPIAAFLTLDWLAREPEKARAALARGHDRITGV